MEQAVAARPDDPGLRHKMPTTGPGPLAPSERSDISQLLRFPTAERLHRDDPDLYSAIEAIADKHLGFREPRKGFSDSTMEIENRELSERIQSTANQTQTISDQAYLYPGLAFGITSARFGINRAGQNHSKTTRVSGPIVAITKS